MDIKYAILGLLSWKSMAGYDLKKIFSDSAILYWSGNNNQIYRSLVDLHEQGLVSVAVQLQESLPARKVYSITDTGLAQLKSWLGSAPELPEIRSSFLVQLASADLLSPEELDRLLAAYIDELRRAVAMQQEKTRRAAHIPSRTPREALLWRAISGNIVSSYENELRWAENLREELGEISTDEGGNR